MKGNTEEHIQILMQYLAEQKIENAIDYLETLSGKERDCWEIDNITGMVCSYCGQYEEAISFFRKALQKAPDTPDMYYNLADAYVALQDYEHAKLMLKSCEYITEDEQLLEAVQVMREQLAAVPVEKKENNVLMVAYYFPPLSGSGVFRSLKFAKYLPELGWNTAVISAEEPPRGWNFRDDSMINEIPQEVNVVRIPDAVSTQSSIEMSKEQLSPVINFLKDVLKYDREALNIFGSFLTSQKGIMQMITFPCASLCWAWEVVKYIENNVDLKKLDVLYTTSGPASAHLVGFYLNKKYGIPWVTDFRDPWTYNAYGYYDEKNPLMKLLYRLERLLLQNANYNLVVGEGQTEHYVNKFEVKSHQMVCVTNGYDEEDFADLEFTTKKNERFTIGYSGLIYTGQQSVSPVFQALNELREEGKVDTNEVAFRIVGQGKEEENRAIADKYGLANILEQTGYLSHKEALQKNQESDALLLLVGDDEKCKQVYTGKVFEYLRSGKYILAIAPKGGYVDDLLSATGHGETFLSAQVEEIKNAILREYQAWKSKSENEFVCSPLIKLRERKYLTMKLADVLYLAKKREVEYEHPEKKYLVICTGGYPTDIGKVSNTNMFAHKRVLKYIEAGLKVDVFGFVWGDSASSYTYQGINVVCGGERQLIEVLMNNHYEKLLVHFPDVSVYNAIAKAGKMDMPMLMWCHGYEVLSWSKDLPFGYSQEEIINEKDRLDQQDSVKKSFLKHIFKQDNICFIFVSEWMRNRTGKFVGEFPRVSKIIHNYIDIEFFASHEKTILNKLKICAIKSHANRKYANDITAKAIIELSNKPFFYDLEFELYGEGVLFEENFCELMEKNFSNVHIKKGFLSPLEMKKCFDRNHIFLSPTRLDSQGVSTNEAMSAGLVAVSTNGTGIPEFIDNECGALVEYDNYVQIAEEIEYLYYHPEEYQRKSKNAVARMRKQCGYEATIQKEIELINESNSFEKETACINTWSANYWESRYVAGGNSGAGSYNRLAQFKAKIINNFVYEKSIKTVIEWGHGDGNQLMLAKYPNYLGYDVSQEAVKRCRTLFANDTTKRFVWSGGKDFVNENRAELVLSLDVIYHLVEDEVYELYMERLFESSEKYVIIYSSNYDEPRVNHVRHRHFTKYVEKEMPEWRLIKEIKNEFPYDKNNPDPENTSLADFYFYEKVEKENSDIRE